MSTVTSDARVRPEKKPKKSDKATVEASMVIRTVTSLMAGQWSKAWTVKSVPQLAKNVQAISSADPTICAAADSHGTAEPLYVVSPTDILRPATQAAFTM